MKITVPKDRSVVGTIYETNIRIHSIKVIDCPVCKKYHFKITDQRGAYTWHCGKCFSNLAIFIKDDDSVSIEIVEQKYFDVYRLLQIDQELTKSPIYIIARGGCHRRKDETDEERFRLDVYYVEEHTCPTNLVGGRDIEFVVRNDFHKYWDADPHGLFRLVSLMDVVEVHSALGITDDSNLQSHENEAIFRYLLNKEVTNLGDE